MPRAKACDIIIDMKPFFGHCGIVTGNFAITSNSVPPGQEVLHATKKGVFEGAWEYGRAFCFRANTLSRADGALVQNAAKEIKDGAAYGASRAIFKSWSGGNVFGSGSFERLHKYRTRMQNHQGVLKNVYCSELVVVAYQLGLQINQQHTAWIALDGKHTLPSALKTWLGGQATNWTLMGVVTHATLNLSPA